MTRILIADDHPLFRAALTQALRELVPGASLVEAGSLDAVHAWLEANPDTDLVLLDLHMPGSHGLAGLASVRCRHPAVAVAMISANDDPAVIARAIDFGAQAFIPKSASPGEIGAALRALLSADGGFEELTPADNKLSKRQKQLIIMLDRGLSNREIADELGISEHTVKVHLWRLFRRLGVKSRTQTIHYARVHGLLTS